ncbi:MAG UNVERIFIED_CONTAM: DUF3576 domain-containing protein [Rickettsiaceae bacterium]|jgi:hypothetical protein
MVYFLVFCYGAFFVANAFAGDYPKTIDERRAEEMGSVLGGEGIIFRPTEIRNNSTRTEESKVNNYLWNATKDIVEDIAPIANADPESGLISTEWYSNKNDPKRSFKVKVQITGDVIAPESITTDLKQRFLKDGRWLEDTSSSKLAMDIEK